jgi:DNA polymerase-3 subunit epsilon
MKTIIVFDTETTGLPDKAGFDKYYPSWDVKKYNNARIIQLGYSVYTLSGFLLSENSFYIKPNDWTITKESEKIHGINQEICEQHGIPIKDALRRFDKDLADCILLVGHNSSFDINIIASEAWRSNYNSFAATFENMPCVCTMRATYNICKLKQTFNGREVYKFPKLCELHKYLFGVEPIIQHNALEDVRATAACYFELKRRGEVI